MLNNLIEKAFDDTDITLTDIPNLDLYMDQILTLIDDGLSKNKRIETEKILTKTMINNYSKENIITPIKGKKYSRKQIIQLLCIINLKPNLALSDIKQLIHIKDNDEFDIEKSYQTFLNLKVNLRNNLLKLINDSFGELNDVNDPETALILALTLSSGSTYLKRLCEQISDNTKLD